MNMPNPTQKAIEKGCKLTKKELAFINKIAESAFVGENRPLVLVGIADSILDNVVLQSGGVLKKKTLTQLLK